MRALSPRSLEEACRLLAGDPEIVPLAGCTDFLIAERTGGSSTSSIMDLLRIPEIRGIRRIDDAAGSRARQDAGVMKGWEIGATTTFAQLARSRRLRAAFPALTEAASRIGGRQIQNRATLGGNLANASPAGDSLPALLALDAVVIAAGPEGLRPILYRDFHVDYRKTALRRGEIIAWIRIPDRPPESVQFFRKVGTRQAQAISKVVVTLAARRDGDRLRDVRIAAGSVAPVPVRLRRAERCCEGRPGDRACADETASTAMSEVNPIDDVRSTAAYRRFALGRVVRRMILDAARSPARRQRGLTP
jgi:CO/xanthine dehydrogenase FAD-binding subunit